MKVKHLVLVAIGAAALTGCQNEVMNQRGYVPAPATDTPAPTVVDTPAAGPETTSTTSAPTAQTAPRSETASRFEPMTGAVSTGGVDSTRGAAKRGGRKGAAAADTSAAAEGGVYVVQSGDFPEKIARKLHVRLGDLMKANNLTPESSKRLRIGQKLVIPAKSAEPQKGSGRKAAAKGGKKNAKGSKSAPAAEVKDGVYVVQPGDFPEKIARKLHVKLADLMKANDLTPEKASRLQIGQKLVVPGATAAPKAKKDETGAAQPAATGPAPATTANPDGLNDALKEAEKAPVNTTTEVGAPQPDANAPQKTQPAPGEVVVNMDTHYVQIDEDEISVEEFARRHHTTVETLRKINPDMKPDATVFKKNEVVFVPGK